MAKSILIVDDEPELTEYMCRFLQRKGLETFKAADGEEGIRLYRQRQPDCVFLDLRLPKIDGMGVLTQIMRIDPKARVYFTTGEYDLDVINRLRAAGAKDCLTKPINMQDVLKILTEQGLIKDGINS